MFKVKNLGIFVLTGIISLSANAALPFADREGTPAPSLAPMLRDVNPAVVNISTFSNQEIVNPLLNDPFFRRFYESPGRSPQNNQPQTRRRASAGSGVIVNGKEGIIITNHHVIENADEIHVALMDGRDFEAKLVGSDPELDIAVLEIDARDLHDIKLGKSNKLNVGDFVVAIGNPFGLGQTVTTGVVSALGRTGLGIEGYENFIQTDASINPGNSGGALVDLNGKLMGINTAIIAPAGGNIGIGFSIPIDMAKSSMEQILEFGEVRRGQLGISIQAITPELRRAFDLENGQQGALVGSVSQGSPAEEAGIESGDVIVSVDGEETTSPDQLRNQIGVRSIGETVSLALIRGGREKKLKVEIGEPQSAVVASGGNRILDGVRIENNSEGEGVLITALSPNSQAAQSGLRQGDIILSANRQLTNDTESLNRVLRDSEEEVLLYISRNGGNFYLVIR